MVYAVQQALNKENIAQQMAKKLPESALVKIKNNHEIKWEEEGREFYLGGTFYDIVKTEFVKGETWFYCINDTMQSNLYNNYTASLKTNNESLPLSKGNKQTLKFSLSYFILYNNNELVVVPTLNKNHFNLITKDLKSMLLEVNAPPPRLA